MSEARREAIDFLVALVCGASGDVLEKEWRRLGLAGLRPVVLAESVRLRVAAALGRFCELLPARDLDETAAEAAAALALSRSRSAAIVELVLALCRAPGAVPTRAVLFKGAALSLAGLYAGEREFGDADLLVEPEALEGWAAAAAEVGARWERLHEGGYEAARVRRGGTLVELHVALAGEGGDIGGPGFGPVWRRSVPLHAAAAPRLRVPDREAAREIAVHHAVLHHRGDPEYVMRALQDVARLEEGGGATRREPLFARPDVAASVGLLRGIAGRAASASTKREDDADAFSRGLLRAGVVSSEERFARGVDGWLSAARQDGRSRLAVAARRAAGGEGGLAGLAARMTGLVVRYVVGKASPGARRRRRDEERWISFLCGRGAPTRAS